MPRTLVELDRMSTEPLYRQVRRAIEHGIATGVFDALHRLPSSRELATEFAVSRNTINLAYQELIAEGLVLSRERRGLFVNPTMREACESQRRMTVSRIDWPARVRPAGDSGVTHVEKQPDWHRFRYPFLAGQVDVREFPARAWLRCLRDALYQPHIYASLQDSIGSDDPMLVDMVRRHLLPTRGIEAEPDEILITVGSQQGLALLSQAVLSAGDTAKIENPGYLDARHILLRAGAHIMPMSVDHDGATPPGSLSGTDLLYLTPSHQHPTNVTLSMTRRLNLLNLAAEAGAVLVEDDYDSEFRYRGCPSPALKALDPTGDVVYLGTFSKFLSPGLRIGYLVGPVDLVRELRVARRYALRHPPGHLQRALALFIDSGDYHRTLQRHRVCLKHKWELLCAAVRRELPWDQPSYPPGGVSLWVSGPPHLDSLALVRRAAARDVLIERGDIYFLGEDDPPLNHFRIGFAAIPARRIDEGISILGQECRALLS